MHPQLESLFDEAENRYLKPEELTIVSQYVGSLPERLATYRALRDQEVEIMQAVADQLVRELPNETQEDLERSIKNALLLLRYCSMGMLLNDEAFVKARFIDWVHQTMQVYGTQTIDLKLYRLLSQRLNESLGSKAMSLLNPMLLMAQNALFAETASALNV